MQDSCFSMHFWIKGIIIKAKAGGGIDVHV